MALNGNRFKLSPNRTHCPECKGYPPLVVRDGRHVPVCFVCEGRGFVDRPLEVPEERQAERKADSEG